MYEATDDTSIFEDEHLDRCGNASLLCLLASADTESRQLASSKARDYRNNKSRYRNVLHCRNRICALWHYINSDPEGTGSQLARLHLGFIKDTNAKHLLASLVVLYYT